MKRLIFAITALTLLAPLGLGQTVIRTADPAQRGLKDTDFPLHIMVSFCQPGPGAIRKVYDELDGKLK
jgi:hypothetical protein